MRLKPGDEFRDPAPAARSSGRDRPVYRVGAVVRETPWWNLYRGKKVFSSYHFGRRALEETTDQESLDVFLKTLEYPALNDREQIKDLRDQLFFECQRVLGRTRRSRGPDSAGNERVLGRPLSNLLPEPIDYLQVPNDRDAFAVSNPRQLSQYEPILVFEAVNGVPLDVWRGQQKPALPRILRVLADLLDFLAVAHAEGLLLNGLAPDAVWAGQDDRLHYLGSDRIIDGSRQQKQRRLYPPERYCPGFAPPELFSPEQDLAGGTDLFSWAALAYFLTVGENPPASGCFEEAHFARLGQALAAVPAGELVRVQHWFRISGSRFVHTWPDSFLGVLRECLRPVLAQRPATREALAGLWSTARPRGVPAALAVHTGRAVEVLLAARDLEPGLEIVVRRAAGFVPRTPQEGQLIAEGPLVARVLDRKPLPEVIRPASTTPAPPACYAVFCRVRTDGEPIYSPPTTAPLLDLARPDLLLAFAEEVARDEGPALPPRIRLLEELADATPVARAWLGSTLPRVRRWAVHLLEGQLRDRKTREAAREVLLSRVLPDADAEVRRAGVLALLQGQRRPEVDLVVRIALALGGGAPDSALAALEELPELEKDVRGEAARRLEGERRIACPVCQVQVRSADLDQHLVGQHGYVSIGGPPLPYADALRALWQALMTQRGPAAAALLAGLFLDRHGERAATAYRNAFEAQLHLHAAALGPAGSESEPAAAWRELAACLAAHELSQRVCRELLTHPEPGLRMLARLALVGVVARRLAGRADPAAFRTSLEALCPVEDVEVRLLVCRRLVEAGASKKAAKEVAAQLELDRTTPCPHCNQPVRRRDEREHLRRAHGIYELDGARLTWEAMLDKLAEKMLAPRPDAEAARLWVEVAGDRLNEAGIVQGLTAALARAVPASGPAPSLQAVAGLPQASSVALQLLGGGQLRAGLLLVLARGRDVSLSLLERVALLTGEPVLPADERRRGVELVLTSHNAEPGTADRALEHYLAGQAEPLAVLHLLDELEQGVGARPALQKRRDLLRRMVLSCPACPTALGLAELEEHAWQAHRLVPYRGAWRPAWEVIAALLDEHAGTGDEKPLQRALALAARDDETTGPRRLALLARQKGLRHPLLPAAGLGGGMKVLLWVAVAVLVLVLLVWLLTR